MSLVEKWIEALESWIGTPFVFEGGKKKIGSNCSQFALIEVFDTLGVSTPELLRLKNSSHRRLMVAEPLIIPTALATFCRKVPPSEIQPGDLAVISYANIPMQVVVYKGDGVFIYSTKSMGVVEDPLPGNLKGKIISLWRPKCFEEGT